MKMNLAAASAAVVLHATEAAVLLRASPITSAMSKTLLSTTYSPENPIKGSRLDEEGCMEPDEPEYEIKPYSGSFGPEKISCCRTAKIVIANLEKRCLDCHDAVPCTADMEEKWCPQYLARYKKMKDNVCRPMDLPTAPPTTTTTTEPASKEQAERASLDGGEGKKEKGEKSKDGAEKAKGKSEGKGEGKDEGEGEGGKDKDGKKDAKDGKKDAKDSKKDAKEDEAAKESSKDGEKAKEDEAGDKRLAWCVKMCVEVAQNKECKDEAKCEKFCKEAEPKFAKMKKSL